MSLFGRPKKTEEPNNDDRFDNLTKQFDDLKALVERGASAAASAASAASSAARAARQPAPQQRQQQQKAPEFDMSGLANPAEDVEAFSKGLSERLTKYKKDLVEGLRNDLTQDAQAQAVLSAQLDELGTDFDEAYPDLAENAPEVQAAALKVVNRMKRQGLNPQREMAEDPEGFMEKVANLAKRQIASADSAAKADLEKTDAEGDPESDGFPLVLGGDPGIARETPKVREAREPAGGLVSELRDFQKRARLI